MGEKYGRNEFSSVQHGLIELSKSSSRLSSAFLDLRSKSEKLDVSLGCQDSGNRPLQAHSILLSAFSPFFKNALKQTEATAFPCKSFVYLSTLSYKDLSLALDFIYQGKVNVPKANAKSFYKALEDLQIEYNPTVSILQPQTSHDKDKNTPKKDKVIETKRSYEKTSKRKRESSIDSTSGYETHEEISAKSSIFSDADMKAVGSLPLDDDSSDRKKDSPKISLKNDVSEKKDEKDRLNLLPLISDDEMDDDEKEPHPKNEKAKEELKEKDKKGEPTKSEEKKLSLKCTSLIETQLKSWKESSSESSDETLLPKKDGNRIIKQDDKEEEALNEDRTTAKNKKPPKSDVGLEDSLDSNRKKVDSKKEEKNKSTISEEKADINVCSDDTEDEEEDDMEHVWPPEKDTMVATIFHDSFYIGKVTDDSLDDDSIKVSYMKRHKQGENSYWIWPKEKAILPAKQRSVLRVNVDIELATDGSQMYLLPRHEAMKDLAKRVSERNLQRNKRNRTEVREVAWPPEKGTMIATLFEDTYYIGKVKSCLNRNLTVDVDYMERFKPDQKKFSTESNEKYWVWPPKIEIFQTHQETVLGVKPMIKSVDKFGKNKAIFMLDNYENIYNLANSSKSIIEDDVIDV